MNSTLSPEQTKIATHLLKVMVVPNDNLIEELDKFNTKYKYQAMDNNIVDLFNKLTLKAQGLKLIKKILDMQIVDTSVQSEITIDLNILTKIPNDKLENELNLIELKWDNVPFSKDNKIICPLTFGLYVILFIFYFIYLVLQDQVILQIQQVY